MFENLQISAISTGQTVRSVQCHGILITWESHIHEGKIVVTLHCHAVSMVKEIIQCAWLVS